MKTACFTGHRNLSGNFDFLRADMYDKLERAIINGGIVNYCTGGAIGFDTIAAETVLKLREVYPQITLNLVLPCRPEDQTRNWSAEQKQTFFRIMDKADSVVYTADRYFDGCMRKLNARLVELADFCFCYWDSSKIRSGTAQTVRYALQKPIQVWNFYNSKLEKQ